MEICSPMSISIKRILCGEVVSNTIWIFSKIWSPIWPNSKLYTTWTIYGRSTKKCLWSSTSCTVVVSGTSWNNLIHNPDFWCLTYWWSRIWKLTHVKPESGITFPCLFKIVDCTQNCFITLHESHLRCKLKFDWIHLPKHTSANLSRCKESELIIKLSFELLNGKVSERVHQSLKV